MKYIISVLLFLFTVIVKSQTLSAIQQQNARATGYAIVASKNPGKSFAIYIIKWDRVNSLEFNANNQINSTWHAHAAIKGNYFDQPFVDSDFTYYSSVVTSQAEFDKYKNIPGDWWIVCSTLPAYSNTSFSVAENGNIGIGTTAPISKLTVEGSLTINGGLTNLSVRPLISSSILLNGEIRGYSSISKELDDGFLRLSAGGGTNNITRSYIDLSGYSIVPEMNRNIVFGTCGSERMRIDINGNVGIGTTAPDEKLTVKGKIHTQEVRVDLAGPLVPDYVFANDYKLKSLEEVESFIKENSHLPEIPSAKEIEKNGLMLAEMNMNLLKKIEELTLYAINQEKKTEKLNENLADQNRLLIEQNKKILEQNRRLKMLEDSMSKEKL
jgi:hypothetical protein